MDKYWITALHLENSARVKSLAEQVFGTPQILKHFLPYYVAHKRSIKGKELLLNRFRKINRDCNYYICKIHDSRLLYITDNSLSKAYHLFSKTLNFPYRKITFNILIKSETELIEYLPQIFELIGKLSFSITDLNLHFTSENLNSVSDSTLTAIEPFWETFRDKGSPLFELVKYHFTTDSVRYLRELESIWIRLNRKILTNSRKLECYSYISDYEYADSFTRLAASSLEGMIGHSLPHKLKEFSYSNSFLNGYDLLNIRPPLTRLEISANKVETEYITELLQSWHETLEIVKIDCPCNIRYFSAIFPSLEQLTLTDVKSVTMSIFDGYFLPALTKLELRTNSLVIHNSTLTTSSPITDLELYGDFLKSPPVVNLLISALKHSVTSLELEVHEETVRSFFVEFENLELLLLSFERFKEEEETEGFDMSIPSLLTGYHRDYCHDENTMQLPRFRAPYVGNLRNLTHFIVRIPPHSGLLNNFGVNEGIMRIPNLQYLHIDIGPEYYSIINRETWEYLNERYQLESSPLDDEDMIWPSD